MAAAAEHDDIEILGGLGHAPDSSREVHGRT